jgi:hypothetical protein
VKKPTHFPMYVALYPILSELVREHGRVVVDRMAKRV